MSETDFQHLTPEQAAAMGYERTEPNAGRIALLTVIIVVTIILTCYFVWWWYVWQKETAYQREQAIPIWQELKDVRAYETERLTQYKFIDKTKGVVALPIDRAMEIFAKEEAEGKVFYGGKGASVKPYEPDPNLQQVLDKALGRPSAPAPTPVGDGTGKPSTPAANGAKMDSSAAKNDGQTASPAASKH